ncbi:hypothetical protein FB446DRAFT_829941 [Lentinula raphanica]|uniref:BZIP domain-containing protein n=1 Tax=Lentinula raphanica TaxID=153919 RepID=A0AA38P4H7_9AGAR|nr:hypothetical protein FB446DRAFT_829941 [Lentinula raphanica]KAJ3836051.1 hypothetical protein F5878DRAFT_566263 [Lentinula raphanica]
MSSSTTNTHPSKSDEHPSRLSDIALRKKKNADAQAAFRARRSNYIITLEESVKNLESVVRVLQDSCREASTEAQELQQENNQLRQALRDRENFWRALWPKRGQNSDTDSEFPSYPSPPSTTSFNNNTQYPDNSLNFNQYPASPSVPFSHQNQPYSSWTQSSSHSSNSPHFTESPTLTSASDMHLIANRYPDEQKMPLASMGSAVPYVFPNSRSISPSSSTPPSSSTTSLTSPFPFTFNDTQNAVQDRPDFDYRRQTTQTHTSGEVIALHGGTADVSAIASGSANDGGVRYRLNGNSRRMNLVSDRQGLLPLLPPITTGTVGSENGSQHGSQHGSDGGDSINYTNQNLSRPRRIVAPPSRSPSPDSAPLSGTLAVIKAQAFGALRRTRVRSKRPGEDPAKVSREVLESRGLVSPDTLLQPGPTKRRRMNDDNDNNHTPS